MNSMTLCLRPCLSHDERRYAEADGSSQSDCQQRQPRLDIEQHLAILLGSVPINDVTQIAETPRIARLLGSSALSPSQPCLGAGYRIGTDQSAGVVRGLCIRSARRSR